jgi:hypothetical protein
MRGFVREMINKIESDGAEWREEARRFSRETRERRVMDQVRPVRRGAVSVAATALTLTWTRGQSDPKSLK